MILRPLLVCAALVAGAIAVSPTARAAEITHVVDAFDEGKPWDGVLGLRFVHRQTTSLILREEICRTGGGSGGLNPLCPEGHAVNDTRQLAYHEAMNVLNIDLRVGLWHDFEFYMTLPIVVGWVSELTYDEGVAPGNSLVDGPLIPSLFGVPYESDTRAGFGDLILGFKIAPFHASRDSAYPSWVLGVEYQAPTGEARTAGESAVGSAVHALKLYTAISRPIGIFEPYFALHGTLRFADPSGPFKNERVTQTLVHPGETLGVTLGTELFPWQLPDEDGAYIALDLRAVADFTFEGREFTELFDALGSSGCSPATGCSRTRYTRGERNPETGEPRLTDGVTDVEQYGRFGLGVGLTYQAMRYVKVRLAFDYWHTTEHFLTFADAGRDYDGNGEVDFSNAQGVNEHNPFYNESYDEPGRRFKVDDKHSYQLMLAVEGQF